MKKDKIYIIQYYISEHETPISIFYDKGAAKYYSKKYKHSRLFSAFSKRVTLWHLHSIAHDQTIPLIFRELKK